MRYCDGRSAWLCAGEDDLKGLQHLFLFFVTSSIEEIVYAEKECSLGKRLCEAAPLGRVHLLLPTYYSRPDWYVVCLTRFSWDKSNFTKTSLMSLKFSGSWDLWFLAGRFVRRFLKVLLKQPSKRFTLTELELVSSAIFLHQMLLNEKGIAARFSLLSLGICRKAWRSYVNSPALLEWQNRLAAAHEELLPLTFHVKLSS